jgi:hypothetical protein
MPWPGLQQFRGLRAAAFQAGHEGSIPLARSNPKPQVSATTDVIAAKIMMFSHARVPATCPIEARPPSSGRQLEHCP